MSNETDLDWLARNVHVWPCGKHQPWCYVYWKCGQRAVSGNCITVIQPCVRVEISDWLARRAELQNKPSWSEAPEWANWLAQDEDGEWWFFSARPKVQSVSFDEQCSGISADYATKGEVLGDWRDTLERRPDMHKSEPKIDTSAERVQKTEESMHVSARGNDWYEGGELPPVGSSVTVVEVDGLGLSDLGREFVGEECKVMAVFTRPELSHSDAVDIVAVMEPGGGCCCFILELIHPIRTERDELMDAIVSQGFLSREGGVCGQIADAILSAGFSLRDK